MTVLGNLFTANEVCSIVLPAIGFRSLTTFIGAMGVASAAHAQPPAPASPQPARAESPSPPEPSAQPGPAAPAPTRTGDSPPDSDSAPYDAPVEATPPGSASSPVAPAAVPPPIGPPLDPRAYGGATPPAYWSGHSAVPSPAPPKEPPARFSRAYFKLALMGGVHAHRSRYERFSGETAEQDVKGAGMSGLFLLGLSKQELALGLTVTGIYVPNAKVRFDDVEGMPPDGPEEFRRATWAFSVGPGVAYQPHPSFRLGGFMGGALESVPEFGWPSNGNERLAAFGMGVWAGFEWRLGTGVSLGVVALGETRAAGSRDIDVVDSQSTVEQSFSASFGASLTLF